MRHWVEGRRRGRGREGERKGREGKERGAKGKKIREKASDQKLARFSNFQRVEGSFSGAGEIGFRRATVVANGMNKGLGESQSTDCDER